MAVARFAEREENQGADTCTKRIDFQDVYEWNGLHKQPKHAQRQMYGDECGLPNSQMGRQRYVHPLAEDKTGEKQQEYVGAEVKQLSVRGGSVE